MTTYTHKHHIIPKHAGGTDEPENLVELTIEEHAKAHYDLYLKYGQLQDRRAYEGLAKLKSKQEIVHEILRQPKSEEHRKKISAAHMGMKKPWARGGVGNKGKPKSEEHRKKISEGHSGMKKPWLIGNKNAEGKRNINIECPHCRTIGRGNMKRYHFDNCKRKEND